MPQYQEAQLPTTGPTEAERRMLAAFDVFDDLMARNHNQARAMAYAVEEVAARFVALRQSPGRVAKSKHQT